MKNKVFKKTIKVIAIIGAYFISMIGSAIIGSAMTVVALEQKKKEELKTVKTEVKETEEKKDDERIIIKGFSSGTEKK